MSKVDPARTRPQQSQVMEATISQRESSLKVGPLTRCLDIREFSSNAKAFYATYLADRRKLMGDYTRALYAPNRDQAVAALGSIRILDSFYAASTDAEIAKSGRSVVVLNPADNPPQTTAPALVRPKVEISRARGCLLHGR